MISRDTADLENKRQRIKDAEQVRSAKLSDELQQIGLEKMRRRAFERSKRPSRQARRIGCESRPGCVLRVCYVLLRGSGGIVH